MKRRDFIRSSFQLGLLTLAGSFSGLTWTEKAFAQNNPKVRPPLFILVYVQGGWDTSLAMAPWTQSTRPAESDYFIEYSQDQLIPFGSSFLGPAMAPLKSHLDRMAVVNGIFMSAIDGGHPSAALYAQSGNGQGNLGFLSAELESSSLHSPFGILSNSALYTANKNKMAWDLTGLMNDKQVVSSDDIFVFQNDNTELAQARGSMLSYADKVQALNNMLAKSSNLTDGDAIAAALASGLTQSVYYQVSAGNLDTHSAHAKNHLKDLTTNMDSINNLLNSLQNTPGISADGLPVQDSLLNQTTLMVVSEFTRTPALNGSLGKDHNPQANSALIIGPGVKPGVVIGENKLITKAQSSMGISYLVGGALDKTTQNLADHRDNAFLIHPENVIATVTQSMGFSPGVISPDIGAASVLKAALKRS